MKIGKGATIGIAIAVAVIVIGMLPACAPAPEPVVAPAPEKKVWRIGTSAPGTYGYTVSAFIADALRKGMPDYDVFVYPYVSTTASMKSFCKGEIEITYAAEPGLAELYSFVAAFKGFEPRVKKMIVHSLWTFPMETFILILPEKKDKIRTWEDLKGLKIFRTPIGFMNWINITRALDIVGIPTTHVEVDVGKIADALRAGTIDATALYTTALVSLPGFGKTLDITTPLWGVNPTPAQREMLAKAGFPPVKIDIKKAFTGAEIRKLDELWGVPFHFGFHCGIDIPEEAVYRKLKVLEAAAADLAKLEPGFAPLAKDFAGYQVAGIRSIPEVPVHPGLAKYLKEKGLWNPAWVIATEATIKAAIAKMKK